MGIAETGWVAAGADRAEGVGVEEGGIAGDGQSVIDGGDGKAAVALPAEAVAAAAEAVVVTAEQVADVPMCHRVRWPRRRRRRPWPRRCRLCQRPRRHSRRVPPEPGLRLFWPPPRPRRRRCLPWKMTMTFCDEQWVTLICDVANRTF